MPTVIVTGCSRPAGFGQHTARKLALSGFDVYATMRDAARGAELAAWARARGLSLTVLEHDVTCPEQNAEVVERVLGERAGIDALVNNVGVSSFGALETLRDEHIRLVMETNFFSAVDMTRAVLPVMRWQNGGRVLFVSSLAGMTGVPGESIYCASKFALEGFTEALAMETARFGIHISSVRPGFFATGMSAENTDATSCFARGSVYDTFNERVVASTAAGEARGEDPQLVADTIFEALTTRSPRLRWYPGVAAPRIRDARSEMSDEAWRGYVMSELGMSDWLVPETRGVCA